ncbi:response regulator [Aquidulcibacter sp.]|jgi:signal transduction histidine kinase/CheY-like chemotaxis protein|uniref:response regulator n=1 Tax=Aquidulcibacter sp. TaxID=2052990 RepID=UPI0028A62954|nr:response regulator [Aquidulcibacter sp.]
MDTQAAGFAEVGLNRAEELKTRLAVAVFLAFACFFIVGGYVPFAWLAIVVLGQVLDWYTFKPLRLNPEKVVSREKMVECVAIVALNALVYTSIAAILWVDGGEAGRIFATLIICGALLHSTLHAARSTALLAASNVPMCLYLIGLPITSWIYFKMEAATSTVILIGSLVYLAHLAIIIRRSFESTDQLVRANAEAQDQKTRAESASQTKSDFLATVTHEIRTPMNAVMASAILLRRTKLSKVQSEHVDMLNDAVDTLLALLNDVLDMSKIEAGKMTVERVDFPVIDELQAAVRIWDPRASDKNLSLRFKAAPDFPTAIKGDPLRIRQILFNLISNAVKFTETGSIDVSARTGLDANGRRAMVLEVADTGCGISAETLSRLFAEFEQGNQMIARKKGGTGLGLAISRRLAELMDGSLGVRSIEGEGSVFTVTLPYDVADSQSAHDETEDVELEMRPLRILVAEDHPTNQKIVSLFLSTMGWSLAMANDGVEALEMAGLEEFDVILMDMQMPNMDGLEATRRLRASTSYTQTVPIIALTANAMDHHRTAFMEAGADAFVPKPLDPNVLIQTILTFAKASMADVTNTNTQSIESTPPTNLSAPAWQLDQNLA